ncbi:hypothetical protein KP509_37G026900 [Ceratopteris richardii]|uniref:Retrovirus-related Pol polyprotein from transposon TNT 1-94-like beta-barrel domain-containing protein n=1 Tax=Ceratopteris richardii TaxID=49495 RepID=A0A8T2Q7L9_CERRI|nr:hypothetical protein KP509_37G026900 [Ceratopteris richardii]
MNGSSSKSSKDSKESNSSTSEEKKPLRKAIASITLSFPITSLDEEEVDSISLSNIWILDNGASKHITPPKNLFSSMTSSNPNKLVTFANNQSFLDKGIGTVSLDTRSDINYLLCDVLYVLEIVKNMISISAFLKEDLKVIFEDIKCIVRYRV